MGKIIIVTGPTAVGKTALVEELAKHIPITIINADMGQLYTKLSIGTAKPDWRNSFIPHYLFDIIDEPCHYTAATYRQDCTQSILDAWRDNRLPIIVGGSLFYIQGLLWSFSRASQTVSAAIDRSTYSWELLASIDPARARALHPHDTYRIHRALDIWFSTGTLPSHCLPVYDPLCSEFGIVYLTRTREQLYRRINERAQEMVKAGLLKEVASLMGTEWESFIGKKGIIGYRALFEYCKGPLGKDSLVHALDRMSQETRHYAKRQISFWRMLQQKLKNNGYFSDSFEAGSASVIEEIDLTFADHDLYLKQLAGRVQQWLGCS